MEYITENTNTFIKDITSRVITFVLINFNKNDYTTEEYEKEIKSFKKLLLDGGWKYRQIDNEEIPTFIIFNMIFSDIKMYAKQYHQHKFIFGTIINDNDNCIRLNISIHKNIDKSRFRTIKTYIFCPIKTKEDFKKCFESANEQKMNTIYNIFADGTFKEIVLSPNINEIRLSMEEDKTGHYRYNHRYFAYSKKYAELKKSQKNN